jgi:hypothetical protein
MVVVVVGDKGWWCVEGLAGLLEEAAALHERRCITEEACRRLAVADVGWWQQQEVDRW